MNLSERIETFVKFGQFLSGLKDENSTFMQQELESLKIKIKAVEQNNNCKVFVFPIFFRKNPVK